MSRRSQPECVVGELSAIPYLSRAQLVDLWTTAHGRLPPKGISRRLLEYVAAYDLQSKAFGGLKPQTRLALRRITDNARSNTGDEPATEQRTTLKPGARLLREWNGHTHQVDVLTDGFAYDGEIYQSLTAVARIITGTYWSGPRFFGL